MDHATTPAPVPFADPTALGLIGLAVGCASLVPVALGFAVTPAALETAAWFCLLFGGGCQLVAGLLSFANRNALGGTLLTAFSFNWFLNGHVLLRLVEGVAPDPAVGLAVDVTFLLVFAVMTYAFGFYSSLLFAFLLDIDVLYACRIATALTGTTALTLPIVATTVLLGILALWLAFAGLVNPAAGRAVFPVPGPLFHPRA